MTLHSVNKRRLTRPQAQPKFGSPRGSAGEEQENHVAPSWPPLVNSMECGGLVHLSPCSSRNRLAEDRLERLAVLSTCMVSSG